MKNIGDPNKLGDRGIRSHSRLRRIREISEEELERRLNEYESA